MIMLSFTAKQLKCGVMGIFLNRYYQWANLVTNFAVIYKASPLRILFDVVRSPSIFGFDKSSGFFFTLETSDKLIDFPDTLCLSLVFLWTWFPVRFGFVSSVAFIIIAIAVAGSDGFFFRKFWIIGIIIIITTVIFAKVIIASTLLLRNISGNVMFFLFRFRAVIC